MKIRELEIKNTKLSCLEVGLPKSPLIIIVAPKGYIMCGYLNIGTAERLGQAAAIVRGVNSVEEILKGKVSALTSNAKKLGISEGMLGEEAVSKMV